MGYDAWPATVKCVRATLSLFIWVLVMSGFAAGASVALAGSAKPEDAKLEDQEEIENSGAVSRRVPCDQVVSHIDKDLKPRHVTDIVRIAKEMHTSVLWVERCMESYGRRVREETHHNAEEREQLLETWEEDEPEEVGPEEMSEPGVEDRSERQTLRSHPERERQLHAPKRTPKADQQMQ
ncbi:MAG: hypothetical protein ACHQ9S_23090 [Candidatus Binatia bacterium]